MKPLSGGRYRSKEVCAQVQDALRGASVFNAETETLVCLLRLYHAAGRARECDAVAALIQQRAIPQVAQWAERHLRKSAPHHREQCAEAALSQMWDCVFSDAPRDDFWEVSFWLCLKRRFVNALVSCCRVSSNEVSLMVEFDRGLVNYIDIAADNSTQDALSRLMMEEALSAVPDHCLRALSAYVNGHEQAEIAEECGVTDRTVRNWIRSAKKIVRAYYE